MKTFAPKYYKRFNCITNKCGHSCCVGWEIDVDRNAIEKYRLLNCEYKEKILDSIDFSESPHFVFDADNRCPHLDENNLCRIIKNAGEQYLCDICREHPRFYNFTNYGKEVGVGMSCEEACRIILNSDDYDVFDIVSEDIGKVEIIDFDAVKERERVYKIIKDDALDFYNKIGMICDYYDIVLDDELIVNAFAALEYIDNSRKKLFSAFRSDRCDSIIETKVLRALAYFVYRHCTEALDLEEFAVSLSFSMLCSFLIASISNEKNIEEMARIVSEEIEYSQDNTDKLMDLFYLKNYTL